MPPAGPTMPWDGDEARIVNNEWLPASGVPYKILIGTFESLWAQPVREAGPLKMYRAVVRIVINAQNAVIDEW